MQNATATAPSAFTLNAAPSSWLSVRACKWLLTLPLRKGFWKTIFWLVSVLFVVWQHEKWHGRKYLAEQQAKWRSVYGEFALPISRSVPDDQNFFTAPVFRKFIQPPERQLGISKEMQAAWGAMPHAEFLHLEFPPIPIPSPAAHLFSLLQAPDYESWASEQINSGKICPQGLSTAGWFYASFPECPILDEMVAALDRPESLCVPTATECFAAGEQLNDHSMVPFPNTTGILDFTAAVALRAKAAALAGDGVAARNLTEICLRLAEAYSDHGLVRVLVGQAIRFPSLIAVKAGIQQRCWTDADLQLISKRLSQIDEEAQLLASLKTEALWFTMIPQDVMIGLFTNQGGVFKRTHSAFTTTLIRLLSKGFLDSNYATHLDWWQQMLVPNGPSDDLWLLKQKMDLNNQQLQAKTRHPNPRNLLACIALPALSGVADEALRAQTHRRQLMTAIAMERYYLAKSSYPSSLQELVPLYLPGHLKDPYKPDTEIKLEIALAEASYRITSSGKDVWFQMPKLKENE